MVKVLVLGFDGGSWNILNGMLKNNNLKNFKKLIDNGCYGSLESTIPPATYPGWKCYSTGKNPGKLGVYGFLRLDMENKKIIPNDSTSFKSKEIWDYLSSKNISVGVINMPTTSPPKKVNGFMISHSLIDTKRYTYPKELEDEIVEKFNYYINLNVKSN